MRNAQPRLLGKGCGAEDLQLLILFHYSVGGRHHCGFQAAALQRTHAFNGGAAGRAYLIDELARMVAGFLQQPHSAEYRLRSNFERLRLGNAVAHSCLGECIHIQQRKRRRAARERGKNRKFILRKLDNIPDRLENPPRRCSYPDWLYDRKSVWNRCP